MISFWGVWLWWFQQCLVRFRWSRFRAALMRRRSFWSGENQRRPMGSSLSTRYNKHHTDHTASLTVHLAKLAHSWHWKYRIKQRKTCQIFRSLQESRYIPSAWAFLMFSVLQLLCVISTVSVTNLEHISQSKCWHTAPASLAQERRRILNNWNSAHTHYTVYTCTRWAHGGSNPPAFATDWFSSSPLIFWLC